MLIDFLLFAVGLVGLYIGAEWLVGGSVRLAQTFGVSSFIVGLTLVSMGTSAPELVVSGLASWEDRGGLAVGNVLGSNVANTALILGVSALLVTIRAHRELLIRDLPIMVGTAVMVLVLGWSGEIGRIEGGVLLISFVGYLLILAHAARSQSAVPGDLEAIEEMEGEPTTIQRDLAMTVVGLIVLAVGANLLVNSAVSIAGDLGVPEVVIGLTMVAFGTSLPELAASVSAARRNEGDIVLGNIIGSNIFNVTLILGVASLVRPLPISAETLRLEIPIVIGLSLLLVPFAFSRMRIDRWEGGVLLASYTAFILWTAL